MKEIENTDDEWDNKAEDLEGAIDDVAQRKHAPKGFKETITALVDDYETRRLLRQIPSDAEDN